MLKNVFFLFILLTLTASNAQSTNYSIKKGDLLVVLKPTNNNYKHIDFPRKNIIIKRGEIADFKSLIGLKLIVLDITYSKNNNPIATLQREDGKPFFRFYKTVKADLNKAIKHKELKAFN